MGRNFLLVFLLASASSVAADSAFVFLPSGDDCAANLARAQTVHVLWQSTRGAHELQALAADDGALEFLDGAAGRNDLLVVLRFPNVEGSRAAAALFQDVMRSVGLNEGTEERLGGGLTSEGPDGFVAGFYRDAKHELVAGHRNGENVRTLDILLSPGSPSQRAALLGALRPQRNGT